MMETTADPVVVAYRSRQPLVERLHAIQLALAESAAELAYMREHAEGYGEPDDQLEAARAISRRVRALKRLAQLDLAVHRADHVEPDVDPDSDVGQAVMAILYDKVVAVAADVLAPDRVAELAHRLAAAVAADPAIPWRPRPRINAAPSEPPPEPGAPA